MDEPYLQYAALPYRLSKDGHPEILLVTSRETKRWIIPKGWPIKGLTPAVSAAREAYEESGVRGAIAPKPCGTFSYEKPLQTGGQSMPFQVQVFPLLVRKQAKTWPEQRARETRWFTLTDALNAVDDGSLRELLASFALLRRQAMSTPSSRS